MRVAASRDDRFAMNSGDRTREVTVHVSRFSRLFIVAIVALFVQSALAATISPRPLTSSRAKSHGVRENPRAKRHMRHLARGRRVRSRTVASLKRKHYYERFYTSS